jgi:hypothetical protein
MSHHQKELEDGVLPVANTNTALDKGKLRTAITRWVEAGERVRITAELAMWVIVAAVLGM